MLSSTIAVTDFVLYKGSATTDLLVPATGESITKLSNSEYIIFLGTAAGDKLTSDVYKLKVTGVMTDLGGNALSTTDATKNEKTFGGLDSAATTPQIVSLTQTDARTVVATFNQDMKTAALANVANVTVTYDSTTINAAATTAPAVDANNKTKVTFKFASDLAADKVAKLNILAADFGKFTDITGNIAMVKNATTNYEVQFGTQSFTASALALTTVTGVDQQTLELAFNQDINFSDTTIATSANFMTITKADGTAVTHSFKYAEKTASNKVRVYFTNTGMDEGTVYKLAIVDNAAGDDLFTKTSDGTALDASVTANATQNFGYNATVVNGPSLTSVTPLSNTVVQLTFDKTLSADPAQGTNLVFKNGTTTFATGKILVADTATDKKVFTATLTDGVFLAGTTYTVEVVSGAITDKYGIDGLVATNGTTVPHLTFGGSASALANTVTALSTSTSVGGFIFSAPVYNSASGTAVALTNAADVSWSYVKI